MKTERLLERLSQTEKTDRNRFTRMCIGEALVELLKKKEFSEIKVSAIAKLAGISRMTYYHYYETKTDVLRDYLHEIVAEYIKESEGKKDIGTFHEYAHILHCISFFDQYADFILTLVHADLYSIVIDAVNEFMLHEIQPVYHGSVYKLYYYAGALLNTFIQWEENGKKEPAEEIANILYGVV